MKVELSGKDDKTMMEKKFNFKDLYKKVRSMRETNVLITIIFLSVLLSIFTRSFLTPDNIRTTVFGFSADGIIAIGMTTALVSGGFDLSVGSIFGLSGVITGMLYLWGMSIWLAALIALFISLILGVVNGIFIGKIGINPFITTLAMMGIGSNEEAAILSGINTSRVKISVYILTAILSSIAGILTLSRFGVAIPTGGEGTEMRVMPAAVIRGASINGGEGTVLGIILLNIINNGLMLLNISVYYQVLISSLILLAAVTKDFISYENKVKKLQVGNLAFIAP